MTEPLIFDDITLQEIPVRIKGKEYVLREASGEAAARWRSSMFRGAKIVDGKPQAPDNMGDLDLLLVSLCLFEIYEYQGERKDRPVILAQIKGWPDRIVSQLASEAKRISGLMDMDSREELLRQKEQIQMKLELLGQGDSSKNSLDNTTDGSV